MGDVICVGISTLKGWEGGQGNQGEKMNNEIFVLMPKYRADWSSLVETT